MVFAAQHGTGAGRTTKGETVSDDGPNRLADPFGGSRPTVLDLLREIEEQLAEDLLNYGACYVTRNGEGGLVRADPATVVLQAAGDVMPELQQQGSPDYLERMHDKGLFPDEDE